MPDAILLRCTIIFIVLAVAGVVSSLRFRRRHGGIGFLRHRAIRRTGLRGRATIVERKHERVIRGARGRMPLYVTEYAIDVSPERGEPFRASLTLQLFEDERTRMERLTVLPIRTEGGLVVLDEAAIDWHAEAGR